MQVKYNNQRPPVAFGSAKVGSTGKVTNLETRVQITGLEELVPPLVKGPEQIVVHASTPELVPRRLRQATKEKGPEIIAETPQKVTGTKRVAESVGVALPKFSDKSSQKIAILGEALTSPVIGESLTFRGKGSEPLPGKGDKIVLQQMTSAPAKIDGPPPKKRTKSIQPPKKKKIPASVTQQGKKITIFFF